MRRSTSAQFDLFTNVNYLLRRAHQRAEGIFAEAMDGLDVTPRQATLLYVVREHPGASLTEVTQLGGMDRGTISEMVPRMVKRGLLTETRHAEDGRAKALTITAEGSALVDAVVERTAGVADEVLGTLPPEYHPLFVKMLSLMIGLERDQDPRA
ncbi:MAG: winged helix DNA-binding protein [Nocardioidaceae bacterium]|nr:winged helix DNA-binding protein [Nocardioidaceae bacterium]